MRDDATHGPSTSSILRRTFSFGKKSKRRTTKSALESARGEEADSECVEAGSSSTHSRTAATDLHPPFGGDHPRSYQHSTMIEIPLLLVQPVPPSPDILTPYTPASGTALPGGAEHPRSSSTSLERNASSSTAGSSVMIRTPLNARASLDLEGPHSSSETTVDDTSLQEGDSMHGGEESEALNKLGHQIMASVESGMNSKQLSCAQSLEHDLIIPQGFSAASRGSTGAARSGSTVRPDIARRKSSMLQPCQITADTALADGRRMSKIDLFEGSSSTQHKPRRDIPIRPRSASLGHGPLLTSSVDSVGKTKISSPCALNLARTVHFAQSPTKTEARREDQQRSTSEAADVLSPSAPIKLVMPLESVVYDKHTGSERNSNPLPLRSTSARRSAPPPPHLANPASSRGDIPSHIVETKPRCSANRSDLGETVPSLPHRPTSTARSSSITQLWRRVSSTGGHKRSQSVRDDQDSDDPVGSSRVKVPPRRSSSLFLPPGDATPAVPPIPSPIEIESLIRTVSRKSLKRAQPKVRQEAGDLEVTPPPIGPNFEVQLPQVDSMFPQKSTRSIPLILDIRERRSSLSRTPVVVAALTESPTLVSLNDLSDDYFGARHRPHPQIVLQTPTFAPWENSMNSIDGSCDKIRRYRQTLIEIKDDVVFHKVLQDLARLQFTPAAPAPPDAATVQTPGRTASHDDPDFLEMRPIRLMRTPSSLIGERKAREANIRGWFITREIVQGERRHGRLLARGVKTVDAAARALEEDRPPVPHRKSYTSRAKSPGRLRRRKLSICELAASKVDARPSGPLDILIDRLPRLLAVSLALSSRFEHDPSPLGIAQAFRGMEQELVNELGAWAAEVGNFVSIGLSTSLDRSPTGLRRSSTINLSEQPEEVDPDDRLGFADIVMTPITRALRYKLLFKELGDTVPHGDIRNQVDLAVQAAERIAAECDEKQAFDLEDLRRGSGMPLSDSSGKWRKRRPMSMGPSLTTGFIARGW